MKPVRPQRFNIKDYKFGDEVGILLGTTWTADRVIDITQNEYVITSCGYVFWMNLDGYGVCQREHGNNYPPTYPIISPLTPEISASILHEYLFERYLELKEKVHLLNNQQLEKVIEILKKATLD